MYMNKVYKINKNIGETPLEALERFRREMTAKDSENVDKWSAVPMTYAGRLDPMAEGILLILTGEECKKKDKYLGLDKEYEVEILFGIETDSYDILGMPTLNNKMNDEEDYFSEISKIDLSKYVGKFTQEYPPYSSKTVNGKQLHELSRKDELPDEMPTKEVEIYSIEELGDSTISGEELLKRILNNIKKVNGDFRQVKIINAWQKILDNNKQQFPIKKIRVKCSSGTYMRSLAHRMGKDLNNGALALSINRTKILDK